MKIKISKEIINKEVCRRNKLFKGKSNPQKRVLIAKDILSLIQKKKIRPKNNRFFDLDGIYLTSFNYDTPIRNILIQESCSVCAVGAMMVSATLFNNKYRVADETNQKVFERPNEIIKNKKIFKNGLNKIFPNKMLVMIEVAYELGDGAFRYDKYNKECIFKKLKITNKEFDKCINFGLQFGGKRDRNQNERLFGIMENIISNKGDFIP